MEGGRNLAAGDTLNGESQFRMNPAGKNVYANWMQTSNPGKDFVFARGSEALISDVNDDADSGSSGGGGCSVNPYRGC